MPSTRQSQPPLATIVPLTRPPTHPTHQILTLPHPPFVLLDSTEPNIIGPIQRLPDRCIHEFTYDFGNFMLADNAMCPIIPNCCDGDGRHGMGEFLE
jgi:hypothetical protein